MNRRANGLVGRVAEPNLKKPLLHGSLDTGVVIVAMAGVTLKLLPRMDKGGQRVSPASVAARTVNAAFKKRPAETSHLVFELSKHAQGLCTARCDILIGQRGPSEVGTSKVRPDDISASEIGSLELGVPQLGPPKIGVSQVGSSQVST
jgi:hypothetical protein